jgi:CRISPR-associated protein Cmr6
LEGLLQRQRVIFDHTKEPARLSLEALATAPFTTGLGNEHPLENGFAFLNPYGLPYLPGSGVKGVLRQAARELARLDTNAQWKIPSDWNERAITALFGKQSDEGDTDHLRGALTFWDVIPQIKGDSLTVEIMTPHQSHYYQQKNDRKAGDSITPHDSGQPTPISFLTVPPGSGFTFHVCCDLTHLERLAPELAADGHWKTLLTAAFEHAFAWLGFGAKTAVGYGAMQEDPKARERELLRLKEEAEAARRAREKEARQAALAQMSPIERDIREFLDRRQDKNQPEISALLAALEKGQWSGEDKAAVAEYARTMMQAEKKWKEKSEKKNPEKDKDYQHTLKVMKWLKG